MGLLPLQTQALPPPSPAPLPQRLKAPPQTSLHLVERRHSLGQLGLYLRQGLRLLQRLLQLLLSVVQPLGQLTALLFTLEDTDRGKGGARSN